MVKKNRFKELFGILTPEQADIMRKVLEEKRKHSDENSEQRMKEQLKRFDKLAD